MQLLHSKYAEKNVSADVGTLSKRVEDEVKNMSCVRDHPHIIQLEYAFKLSNHVFICMEYFEGMDLLTVILSSPGGRGVSEETARFLFFQLVKAIHFCRTRHVIHGDVKLENVLVNAMGQLKLIDFGFSHSVIEGRVLEVSSLPLSFFFSHLFLLSFLFSFAHPPPPLPPR